ncbi:MAG: DUF2794 domain-containing protein [Alphaproteobacteria bacterium]
MTEVVRLRDVRKPPNRVFFNRTELNRLLSLYSRRVMSGEWRDYAIDQGPGRATFSVFRHSAERPTFSITKLTAGQRKPPRFALAAGPRKLMQSASIDEILILLERQLRLVWTAKP